jgi:hypothetical protein
VFVLLNSIVTRVVLLALRYPDIADAAVALGSSFLRHL